ncbi:MAG TPA: 7-cyano-7-deazaguanine synthase, partial [Methanomassiliicoccales archaeon]|nr:7-cyano-7-deazaguanine synthase [Methanomassiliicoccales archaeon]
MFDPKEFVEEKVEELRAQIKGKAIIACSGGVDSTAAAAVVSKAIGERLLAVYVDTGLMRKGETKTVDSMLSRLKINYRIVDASEEFL